MSLYGRRPFKDASPLRVHVLMAVSFAGLIALFAISVTSVTKDRLNGTRLVERAERVARSEGKEAAKEEVKEQVAEDIELEVTDQLDERLIVPSTFPTTTLPDELQPAEPVPETPSGPFDLTTTTLPEPPIEPPPTTTTIIEVPTTVTLPDPGLEPLP